MPVYTVELTQKVWMQAELRIAANSEQDAHAKLNGLDLFTEAEKRGRWNAYDADKVEINAIEETREAEHDLFI